MTKLLETFSVKWIKGVDGSSVKDENGTRKFTYTPGSGKERQSDGEQMREFECELVSLDGDMMSPIMSLERRLYKDGEETFTLKLFVVPDDVDIPNAKRARFIVTYDENGNMTNKPDFQIGIGGPERISGYKNGGYFNLSDCPDKINFQRTVNAFKKQSRDLQFHNPRLFRRA